VDELRRQRLWQLGAAGLFAAIVVVVVVVVSGAGSDSLTHLSQDRKASQGLFGGIQQHGQDLGDPKAAATLVEYGDLQCPFCRRYETDALPTIVSRYVRTGKLRLRFEPVAILGPDSSPAARLALAASLQNRLWELADVFYLNQDDENSGYVTPEFLSKVAGATPGLDANRALKDMDSTRVAKLLDRSSASFAGHSLSSTPSFLIEKRGQPAASFEVSDPGNPDDFVSQLDPIVGH
jgi:thioredoxin family protein